LLDEIGLNGERARMDNLSAAMGARFAEIAAEFVDTIKELGPNPLGKNGKQSSVDSIQCSVRTGDGTSVDGKQQTIDG
jgi:hypothetical protein